MMKPVFLIGFMGCGKTTLGRAVSSAAGLEFVDLDEFIESEQGASIREIFAEKGEQAFRQLETEALRRVAGKRNIIVACGGGTPCVGANMDVMLKNGDVVWLKANIARLMARLEEGKQQRPLLASLNSEEMRRFVEQKLAERESHYQRASKVFDSSFMDTLEELESSVQSFCELMNLKQINHE